MKKPAQFVAMLVLVALVAAGACYFSAKIFGLWTSTVKDHEWIHKQLNLSQDEQKALQPIEKKFEGRKREIVAEIRSANRELAEAIKQDLADSPRVAAAVEKIHQAQGELQKATLEHVFEMKQVLTPEHYRKLLDLTTNELDQVNGGE